MTTWTAAAVASSGFDSARDIWRAVEAQHVVSTMRVVDTLQEQRVLEAVLDRAKPPLRDELHGLHYLLAAPFRYRPQPPGSRFRGVEDAGVFYGAEQVRTACAEAAWWRWRGFVREAPGLPPMPPVGFTIFPVRVSGATLDLRRPPLDRDRAAWTHPSNYGATQAFARTAREAQMALIVYESVRDPQRGANVAVLRAGAFGPFTPTDGQSWQLLLSASHAHWLHAGGEAHSFPLEIWR